MPTGNDDLSAPKTPTMIAARQIAQIDNVRFSVEVEWDDNEDRDDEQCTIFKFSPPGGSGAVYVGGDYTAAGTGRCKGTVVMPAGEYTVTAQCSRWVTISDVGDGTSSKVSLQSPASNGVPCTVGKKGGGQGHGQGGNPNKPNKG